ncbi:IS3 family transposase [Paenibacillus sp. L3-i20]|uniref:IS3 family transposase n=1 Tax=Paenibacillus sp. L3-i20 TaxID=2905833 RepID=UPI0035CD001F
MGTRLSYPVEVKMKAIEMRLVGVPVKDVMDQLLIRNKTQLKTWMKWYRNGEVHRLEQPVGKQYSFNKGPEFSTELARLEAENRFLKQQIDPIKKVQGMGKEVVREGVAACMKQSEGSMDVQMICMLFGISRATYYRWKKEPCNSKGKVTERIRELCHYHRFRCGYRKITALLREEMRINHKAVQRIMQQEGWQCKVKVKKRKKNGAPAHVAENLLKRQFKSDRPLQKLVTDITYLPYGPKMLYLSSILDLFNGEIVAYTLGDTQDTAFVLDTLHQLPELPEECVLHSDQGSVYTSSDYQEAVKGKGITMSMSRKGTPVDNAPIESFHASLKCETFYLDRLTCTTTAIVMQTVKDYIDYYNRIRIQTKLNNQSPIQYRQLVA